MNFLEILADLALTALVYGLAPMVLYIGRSTPIRKRSLKIFHIAYTVAIAFFFAIASSLAGNGINFWPAVLWGTVFYRANSVKLSEKGLILSDDMQSINSELDEIETELLEHSETCEQDFYNPTEPSEPLTAASKQHFAVGAAVPVVLAILLLVSIVGNVYQATSSRGLSSENEQLAESVSDKNRQISQLTDKVNAYKAREEELEDKESALYFYNKHIRFLINGSSYYHRFDCPNVQKSVAGIPVSLSFSGSSLVTTGESVKAHDVEYCIKSGYSECPVCKWDSREAWEDRKLGLAETDNK